MTTTGNKDYGGEEDVLKKKFSHRNEGKKNIYSYSTLLVQFYYEFLKCMLFSYPFPLNMSILNWPTFCFNTNLLPYFDTNHSSYL